MSQQPNMLSERFEIAFNQIHYQLKRLVNSKNENFIHVLNLATDRHAHVKSYYSTLKQYAKLRNSLVHYKLDLTRYIAEPHTDIVDDIERIQKILSKPPIAFSIASKNVVSFQLDSNLENILNEVEKTRFSQFPIYDGSEFQGLLTEGGITNWLSQNIQAGMAVIEGTTAAEILKLEKRHNVDFINRDSDIYELETLFETYFEQNKKLEAVLITENGTPNQKPIGIITTWDLVQIDHTSLALIAN